VKQQLDHDAVSLHMNARPEDVYALVADVTRTPEFSPEILKCEWLDGATEAKVGARFAARNKVPRRPPWTNKPVVTTVEPGKKFAFARTETGGGTVEWTYEFTAERDGTLVTESYEVTKPIPAFGWFIIGTLFNRKDRRTDLRLGMQQTLERICAVAESQQSSRT
jgi:Polyketide cyclase / dehydrase and lipid transport